MISRLRQFDTIVMAPYNHCMTYRTVEFRWLPKTQSEWQTFTSARKEAARLWNDLVKRHARLRRLNWRWPTTARWQKWAKGRYLLLHSQSVQQIIDEFVEATNATRRMRQNGHLEARYPWRLLHYRDVIYTNQAARFRGPVMRLPHGTCGRLHVRVPVSLPGRLMEVRVAYGRILVVCEVPDAPKSVNTAIGVDLGVNSLMAATDGEKAVVVNGREAKATVQWRNKQLARIQQKQSSKQKRSRRWLRLQRRKYKLLGKARRRIKDICHKATRIVADEFPNAQVYVGEPFNDAAQKLRRKEAQQVSSACNAKLIWQLDYKCAGAIQVPEPYSSQTCPVCGCRQKCWRIYRCHCGYEAPRDVVGSENIRRIGVHGQLVQSPIVPRIIKYRRPIGRRSSGGHPASSSTSNLREAQAF
jgi:putative transposase